MCNRDLYHENSFVFECVYIYIYIYIYSMDPNFAKITVGCGIIQKHTVYAKYTELLKYRHYEYFIYSIMSYQ